MIDQTGPYVHGPSLPPRDHPAIQAAGIDVDDIRHLRDGAADARDAEMCVICAVALGEYDPEDEDISPDLHTLAAGHNRETAVEECRRVLAIPDDA